MLRKVHLHGRLGKKFGRRYDLAVNSPAEAVRALAFQLPGFSSYIRDKGYVVSIGRGTVLDAEAMALRLGKQGDIHITPAAPVSGLETILLGATLLFTAFAAVSVLSMPKVPTAASREEATKDSSYIFDGAVNSTEQGHPVQLVYGRFRVGSVVASAGITTTDVNQAGVAFDTGFVGVTPGIRDGLAGGEWVLAKGGKGGAGSTRAAQEDPNSLQSQATAKILDIIGEGEIVGLVNGLQSIYFDDTPLQNPDGTFNFAGVAVEQRVGLPDQDFIPGFSQAENTRPIDADVKVLTGPVTRSVTAQDVSVARVTIGLPQLYEQNTTNGDLKQSTVSVRISVQADGSGFTDVTTMTFAGKTNSGYQRSTDIRLPPGTQRDIRVSRVTADSDLASLRNETRWELLTEVVEAKLSYPDTAMIGLTIDARQFGSNIPTRSYDIRGLIIEVPSNYDPATRTYSGIWDGTFKRAWSDNPAWVLRDIVVNRRYGLGSRIDPNSVDIWGLYAIAQHNDELVPDQLGGMQPRYTINCCISNPAQAYDVVASIASNFRGFAYWGSGSIVAVQDRPEDPSVLVTPSNVIDGLISYGRITPAERRRSVSVVYWNDPEDGFRLTPEFAEDPDLIRRFGRRGDSNDDAVTAFGVTNRGQAHRMARWGLEDEAPGSNSTALYSVGDDHSFVEPGRVAEIADPMFTQSRRGGRVRSATATTVTLDAPFTLAAGQTSYMRVLLPNGKAERRAIVNAGGSTVSAVTLAAPPLPLVPNPGAVWTIETNQVANRQWRVRSMTIDDAPYEVRAVLHDPTKWARVEQNRDISTPNFMDLPSGPLIPQGDIYAFEFLLREGDAAIPCVQVGWVPSPDPRITFYQAQFRRPGGAWEPFADSVDVSRTVRNAEPGAWGFRARSLDALGRKTAWSETTAYLDGQTDSIPEVTGLMLQVSNDAAVASLVWDRPVDPRPLRVEILFGLSPDINAAASMGYVSTQTFVVPESGYYWARSEFIGYKSPNPPMIEVNGNDLPYGQFVAQLERVASDNWLTAGEKPQVVIDFNGLVADRDALSAKYLALGSPPELTAYRDAAQQKVGDLYAYLEGLPPASSWNDAAPDTQIPDSNVYKSRWTEAYIAIAQFTAAITGQPGTDGLPGPPGADGQTPYIHFAYANSIDGSVDFTTGTPGTRAYEGRYSDFIAADSLNPASYEWREYKGPPFGLAARGSIVIAGDQIIKNGGAPDWDSDAFSTVGYRAGCVVGFRFQPNTDQMAGLNTDPVADASYGSLDFAWYMRADGNVSIYESGAEVQNPGNPSAPGIWVYAAGTGDFQIQYDNRYVRYLYNGVVYREVDRGGFVLFYFDSSIHTPGSRISNVSFNAVGSRGNDGLNGTNGLPGPPGADGRPSYVHFAYADSLDGYTNFTTGDPGGRLYIGVYTDDQLADSGNPALYTWSRYVGMNGENGIPGPPGADGQPTYIHIAYSNAPDGSVDFSVSDPTGRKYIGVYTDNILADSTNPALYTWSLIKGADGLNGDPGPPGVDGDPGPKGDQGPPGITAPQPKKVTGAMTVLDDFLLRGGQTITAEGSVGVQVGSAAGNVTIDLQISANGGAYYSLASNSDAYVAPGEPDVAYATAAYTNSGTTDYFVSIRLLLSGPTGYSIRGDTANYLRII